MNSHNFSIAGRKIGTDQPPFIIAEMSGNHNQSLDKALQIIELAASSGAHAIKLQTYTPETMTLDIDAPDFYIDNAKSLWKGQSLYDLYEKAHTPWEWHETLFKKAKQLGLIVFSTPFDFTAVDFLETLNVPCSKIASFENTDHQLLKYVAKTGKPMIISTGMSTVSEITETVEVIKNAGCKQFVLLKCTSSYPAPASDANLRTLPHMKQLFKCEVGLSDHTAGIGTALASVAMGATVIEKHFTTSRKDKGVDSDFSLEPDEMKMLVTESLRCWESLGEVQYITTDSEKDSKQFRRSLYFVADISKGEKITEEHVRAIRPGYGLAPKHLEKIIGRRAKKAIKKGTATSWESLD